MQITRNSLDTNAGPSDWFTGVVYVDTIAAPSGDSRIDAGKVVTWGEHVSNAQYAQAASITEGEN